MSETTQIEIKLPLPLDVAGTLMKLIGAAYPTSRVRPFGNSHMMMEIDTAERVPEGDLDKFLEGFSLDLMDPEVGESLLTQTGFSAPGWLANLAAQMMTAAIGDAPNYIEAGFTLEAQNLVMSVARSEGQTPHELRLKADARVAQLEAALRERGVDPDTV